MAMVISTNTASINAQRHLAASRQDLDVAMERLSSGQRINSAADDAAGLAIRDKMTSQVEGLNQAVRNANDAISFMQSAEGALEETTNILQRMRTLAVQAVNDTNSESDRTNLNDEIGKLQAEITRIANTSTFNNKLLIDGSMTLSTFQVGHKSGETISVGLSDMSADAIGKAGTAGAAEVWTVNMAGVTTAASDVKLTVDDGTGAESFILTAGGYASGELLATALAARSSSLASYTLTESNDGNLLITHDTASDDFTVTIALWQTGSSTEVATADTETMLFEKYEVQSAVAASSDASGAFISTISVTSGTTAAAAITALDNALVSVGQERAKLGAFQNRLTHAVNNMTNMSANTAAAKSVIADADYAQESSSLAKNQILQQAGTAMLAQANAQAQSVLSLLK
mgnify:FL=1